MRQIYIPFLRKFLLSKIKKKFHSIFSEIYWRLCLSPNEYYQHRSVYIILCDVCWQRSAQQTVTMQRLWAHCATPARRRRSSTSPPSMRYVTVGIQGYFYSVIFQGQPRAGIETQTPRTAVGSTNRCTTKGSLVVGRINALTFSRTCYTWFYEVPWTSKYQTVLSNVQFDATDRFVTH